MAKIVFVDGTSGFSKYYLKFSDGSEGIGSIRKSYDSWRVNVPGSSRIQDRKFKTKSNALKALRWHVGFGR